MNEVTKRIEAIKKKESKEGLNYWERGFVANIGRVSTSEKFNGLSVKQEACLKKIELNWGLMKKRNQNILMITGHNLDFL
jgi:hypothetical protein